MLKFLAFHLIRNRRIGRLFSTGWKSIYLWILLSVFIATQAPAQSKEKAKPKKKAKTSKMTRVKVLGVSLDTLLANASRPPNVDKRYIASYYDYLHLYVLGENRDYGLILSGNGRSLTYKPNNASSVGVGFSYNWLSLSLTLPVPIVHWREKTRGLTKQFGANISINGRRIWFNAYYQSYRGLYLKNPEELDPNWFATHSDYPQRGDLRTQTLDTRLYYSFNYRRFSNPATMFQRERQKISAGSFLVGAAYVYSLIRADSSLLPSTLKPVFPADADLIQYRSSSFSINSGYIYTFVIKKHYFTTLSLRPGISLKSTNEFTAGHESRKIPNNVGWLGDFRIVAGYNNDQYYGGVSYSLSYFSGRLEGQSNLRSYFTYFQIVVGKRFSFQPKGILEKVPGF